MASNDGFDVAVIGAGVVGCAVARRLTLAGARVVVLEGAQDILDGASKGNSAILHTGFDAPPDSLEAACVRAGYAEYLEIHDRLGLALDRAGALVLAWSDDEAARLPGLIGKAHANGVTDIAALDAGAIYALEPELGPGVAAGFRVPGEFLIDPWSAPLAYLVQAVANNAEVRRGAPVTAADWDGAQWRLSTPQGAITARAVVAAAGLWGDHVEAMCLGTRTFEIRPRKGQFVVFDKPAAALVRHILLPVPTETTKGIVVCRTVYGNLLVGPTAEEQEDRRHASLDQATLEGLRARGAQILPGLESHQVTAIYAGLRPATERSEYRITWEPARAYLGLGGIRSTGLSAALGLARHAVGLLTGRGGLEGNETGSVSSPPGAHWRAMPDPAWPQVPRIAEGMPRDWERAGHGGIVCHCELVTRREVEAALSGPLAARTLAGLKRRTRVTMGRCQGFYCAAGLARITKGRLAEPMGVLEE